MPDFPRVRLDSRGFGVYGSFAVCVLAWTSRIPPGRVTHSDHGVNTKNETVKEDTLCRKGTASGKETIFGALPAGGSGATKRMREHRGTRQGAGSIAASALSVAR